MGDFIWFPLNKDGVMASLKTWDGEIKPIGSLIEVWVQVRGIPPKWSVWSVFQQVASSLGKLCDVDWYSLFSSHFGMVRLKIKCKDPTKIPKQRVLELDDKLFLMNYKVEDYEQAQDGKSKKDDGDNGGDDEGGEEDNDLDEDDLLDEDPPTNQDRHIHPSSGAREDGKNLNPGSQPSGSADQRKNASQSSKRNSYQDNISVRKAWQSLSNEELTGSLLKHQDSKCCVNLLRAMELEDKEEEGDTENPTLMEEDGELINLPEEWVYALSETLAVESNFEPEKESRQESEENQIINEDKVENIQEEDNKGKKVNKKWGPIQAEKRSARLKDDGRTALEKAQNLKRKVNLEDSQGKKKLCLCCSF